jgi:hypothetical protein
LQLIPGVRLTLGGGPKVRKTRTVLWIGFLASLACQPRQATQHAGAAVPEAEEIRAAFLVYANDAAWKGRPARPHFTCIQVEGEGDPSPALLQLLSRRNLGLRKGSACAFHGRDVVEPISGSPAVILHVAAVETPTPATARVRGGYAFGRLDGAELVCVLERHGGSWVVTRELSRALS